MLPLQGGTYSILVRESRSHIPCGMPTKINKYYKINFGGFKMEKNVCIKNASGLHARPAGMFVKKAAR